MSQRNRAERVIVRVRHEEGVRRGAVRSPRDAERMLEARLITNRRGP